MRVYALFIAVSIVAGPPIVGAARSVASCAGFPRCPTRSLTPGAVATQDAHVVCNRSTKTVRYVTASEKQNVYANYHVDPAAKVRAEKLTAASGADDVDEVRSSGLNPAMPGKPGPGGATYEIDHLIPLELGGSNDISNLWPQSYVAPWGAHIKDELENRLHKLVCAGTITLPEAQNAITSNWIKAYEKYVAGS